MSGPARVAVIAIHGVGDHPPFEMARSVTNILADLENAPLDPRYCAFGESIFDLNVSPVKVIPHDDEHASGRAWGPLDELYRSRVVVRKAVDADRDSLDHRFMEGQLKAYKGEGPDDTYRLLRLEGVRNSPHPELPEKEVHVYDMWWSDLSTVASAGLRTFGELYQLLFHLGSIGVNNVKAAALSLAATPAGKAWRGFSKAQVAAVSMLAWPIPLLNLNILAVAIALLAAAAIRHIGPAWGELAVAFALLLAAVIGVSGYLLFRRPPFAAITGLIVFGAAGAAGYFAWQARSQPETWRNFSELVVLLLAGAAVFYGVWLLLGPWDNLRPGTKKAFIALSTVQAAIFLLSLVISPGSAGSFWALEQALRLIEVAFGLLVASWSIFWVSLVAALITGKVAVTKTPPNEKDRARRTNWTARLTLTLPALLFLLLTFSGWAGFVHVALPVLPHSSLKTSTCDSTQVLCYVPLFSSGIPQSIDTWVNKLLMDAGISAVPFLLVLTLLAAIIVLWAILPSALDEISSPKYSRRWAASAAALGHWLDAGFRAMRTSGRLIYLGIFLFPLFSEFMYLRLSGKHNFLEIQSGIQTFTEMLGLAVAGAGVALLGFGGRLSTLALGFRPIVRVALDVDNWMREHPDNNPTARICGRYVSLLRYIGQWKGPDDRGYDALIIFAHSQGTVITADLFRFLKAEARAVEGYGHYDSTLSALDRMPVYLFTMGCPLSQLYGLRFPYLYGYAPALLTADHLPNPEDLGVRHWTNAYRTGDYVGRYLWRNQPWELNRWTNGSRTEFPIGPGAHTHYWDNSDGHSTIAEELDAIIAQIRAL